MKFNESEPKMPEKEGIMVMVGDIANEVAPGALLGALTTALTYAGAKIDVLIHPEMIKALADNFHWWNVFTTKHHAFSALVENHGLLVPAIMGVFVAAMVTWVKGNQ